jgi:hypothetical protein
VCRCPGLVQCQTDKTAPSLFASERSFDHLIAILLPPKSIYAQLARWLCQHPVYHPFFTAIAALRLASEWSRFSPIIRCLPQPYHPVARRVAKRRVNLVAKPALDSICQNSSMHVTRTSYIPTVLIDRRPCRKSGPFQMTRSAKHLRSVSVAQSTGVATTEKPLCACDSAALRRRRKPPNKHKVVRSRDRGSFHRTAYRVRAMLCTPVARQKKKTLACRQTSHRASA